MWIKMLAAAGMAAVAVSATACSSSSSSGGAGSGTPSTASASAVGTAGSGALKTANINGVTVVTNAQGFTLYSFAPDTATTSKCTGTCAQIWPPVNAPATAGQGVTGKLGTITRSGGSKQATYDGHPLYTYTADTAPGQAKGNGVNVDGGVWHEVTASGAAARRLVRRHRRGRQWILTARARAWPRPTAAATRRPGPQRRPGRPDQIITAGLRVAGAGLLIAAAAIHLDLYVTGYRSIPVIGGLFLLQIIVGFLVAAVVLVTGSRVAAAAGAVFALATLGGYLLSIWAELFGFKEVRTTAGIVAGVVEVAAFAALAALAVRPRPAGQPSRPRALLGPAAAWLDAGASGAAAAISAVSVVALVLLGVAVAGAGGPPGAGPPAGPVATAVLHTTTINGTTVLTNAKGFTLYSFAPDTASRSVCNGACAQYWPPVTGRPTAGPGVTGRLGTITRSDGSTQATYDGHPLYTYIADTAPGQANGNNLNLNGGVWHEVTASR